MSFDHGLKVHEYEEKKQVSFLLRATYCENFWITKIAARAVSHDTSGNNVREVPKTENLQRQVQLSAPNVRCQVHLITL